MEPTGIESDLELLRKENTIDVPEGSPPHLNPIYPYK